MRALRGLGIFLLSGVAFSIATLIAVYVAHLQGRPDLRPWHTARLDAEFHADDVAAVRTLDDYLRREDALFDELRDEVYARVAPGGAGAIERYAGGSRSDPRAQSPDWNRTFELPAPAPAGGAVLLHGASDSPYSMRAIGEHLHARGFHVVGLRLPGHGTAPAGMLDVRWQDWAAALRLAARHVRARIGPDRPLHLVGYSTGAALAVEYAAARLAGEDLPAVAGLVLISPAIGVSPAAAFASVQARLGRVPGFEKAAWTDIVPEYDPYKYNSFTAHIGDQVYLLTRRIGSQLETLGAGEPVRGFPPLLAFQSVADATVSAPAVVNALFRRLAPEGHALVLFDINRRAEAEPLFDPSVRTVRANLFEDPTIQFDLTALVNESTASDALVEQRRRAAGAPLTREPTGLAWPHQVFSLSHVALPFAPDDPIYGAERPAQPALLYLGRIGLLGERGLLAVSPTVLMRLRHNPFFGYVERRLDELVSVGGAQRDLRSDNGRRSSRRGSRTGSRNEAKIETARIRAP
jgi:alpha-beta hydrolase superfamily lysophospholipase